MSTVVSVVSLAAGTMTLLELLLLVPLTASLSLLGDGFMKLFHDTFGLAPSPFCSNLEMLSLRSDDRLGAAGGGFFRNVNFRFRFGFREYFFRYK